MLVLATNQRKQSGINSRAWLVMPVCDAVVLWRRKWIENQDLRNLVF